MKAVLYGTNPADRYGTQGYFLDDGRSSIHISPNGTIQPATFSPWISWQGVDVVSILVWDEGIEVAFQTNGVFVKKPLQITLADFAAAILYIGVSKTAFVWHRTLEGLPFSQYMYLFQEGSVRQDILLNLIEGGLTS